MLLRSISLCGSIAPPRLLNMSLRPLNRCFPSSCAISISTSDFGRPIRSSRSSAWLLRLEIIDNSQNVPAMIATNTKIGVSSSVVKNAKSSTAVLPGASASDSCECA